MTSVVSHEPAVKPVDASRACALADRLEHGARALIMLEDHAVRHSYHHLARLRTALSR